jgi:hypothetical protein
VRVEFANNKRQRGSRAYDSNDALGGCGDAPSLVVEDEASWRLGHGGGPGAPREPALLLIVVVVVVIIMVRRGGRSRASASPWGMTARRRRALAVLLLARRRGADGDGAAR